MKSYFVSFIGGQILYVQYLLKISLHIYYVTFHMCNYTPIIAKCGLVVVPSYYLFNQILCNGIVIRRAGLKHLREKK